MLKTFYTGAGGWADRQSADGTVQWTSPSGHIYTTQPAASFFFPQMAVPTGELVLPTTFPASGENRGLMMPARRQTRADERAVRINSERRINETLIAAKSAREAARLAACNDPPPF